MKRFLLFCVAMLFAASAGAAYRVPVKPLQEFDVADYGAVSNDGLQDHTAINAAIDAACAAGGGIVKLENSAIYEFGSGTAAYLGVQIDCDNITLAAPAGGNPATFRSLATGTGAHYTVLIGDNQNANGLVPPSPAVALNNIRISNIEFEDTTIPSSAQHGGVYITWTTDIDISTIWCTGLGGKCVYGVGNANKPITNLVMSNIISNQTPSYTGATELAVVHLQSAQNSVIEKFECRNGMDVVGKHCIRTSTNATTPLDNLRISDSTFGNGFDQSVYIGGGQNFFITRCKFYNSWGLATAMMQLKTGADIKNLYVYGNMFFGNKAFYRANGASDYIYNIVLVNNIIDGTITSGTESGTSTTTTMELTGAGWTADEYIGKWIECTIGTCAGDSFVIADNDEDTVDISPSTWTGGAPNNVTFRIVGEKAIDITHANNKVGIVAHTNIISNFFATPIMIAAGNASVVHNQVTNTGMDGSPCVIESTTTANNTGSWGILDTTAVCNDAASGAIDANWSGTDSLLIADNTLSGTALGTAIDAYSTVMRGNSISGFVTGMKPRRSVSLVSNNYVLVSGDSISIEGSVAGTVVVGNAMASGVNEQDSANYSVMTGNFSLGGGIECHTLNGGVGANDLCLGNIGMKDVLSPTGAYAPNNATLPATCTLGEIYVDNDATAGDQMHVCTATNTWTAQ